MVKTRSNLDTSGVGPLCFDPTNFTIRDGIKSRSPIAWDYFSLLTAKWPSASWTNYLLSKPEFEAGPETEWIPRYPLGECGGGGVALWAKMNQVGDITDEVVIKQENLPPDSENLYAVGLANEAVYQGHLSAMNQSKENISQLRGYKFYPVLEGRSASEDTARLYMRYAPHGTLMDVWCRYRANRSYLPELFLWSVLVDLSHAACLLRDCPASWNPIPRNQQVPLRFEQSSDAFILHQDIKAPNCFVNAARGETGAKSPYHAVELGDYGLACARKKDSRFGNFTAGTAGWHAPEQLGYGKFWQQTFFGEVPGHFEFNATTNLWGVGKIMWHLMTLKTFSEFPEIRDSVDRDVRDDEDDTEEIQFNEIGRHILSKAEMERSGSGDQYSEALRDLVYECLRPDVTERPNPTTLLRQARRELKSCWARSRQQGVVPVAFTNGEMSDIGVPRDADIELDHEDDIDQYIFYYYIQGHALGNPEDSMLWVPRSKGWGTFVDHWQTICAAMERRHPHQGTHEKMDAHAILAEHQDGRVAERKDPEGLFDNFNPRPTAKRARSWNPEDEHEIGMRQLLRELRTRTQQYASRQPMKLLVHILENEKFEVDAAEKVLKWLYHPRSYIQFAWAQNQANRQQASAAVRKWKQKWDDDGRPARTFRECLYFVSKEMPGGLRVPMALNKMDFVFDPDRPEEQDSPSEPRPIEVTGDDNESRDEGAELTNAEQLQRLREVQMETFILYENGEIRNPAYDEDSLMTLLAHHKWDVVATVFTIASDAQLPGDGYGSRMPEHGGYGQIDDGYGDTEGNEGQDSADTGHSKEADKDEGSLAEPDSEEADDDEGSFADYDSEDDLERVAEKAVRAANDADDAVQEARDREARRVAPFIMHEISAPIQQQNRQGLEAQLNGVPIARRRNSTDRLVGNREDIAPWRRGRRSQQRPRADEIFMSGALDASDSPNGG